MRNSVDSKNSFQGFSYFKDLKSDFKQKIQGISKQIEKYHIKPMALAQELEQPSSPLLAQTIKNLSPAEKTQLKNLIHAIKSSPNKPALQTLLPFFMLLGVLTLAATNCSKNKPLNSSYNKKILYLLSRNFDACFNEKSDSYLINPNGTLIKQEYSRITHSVGKSKDWLALSPTDKDKTWEQLSLAEKEYALLAWNTLSFDDKAEAISYYFYNSYQYNSESGQINMSADEILSNPTYPKDCDKFAILTVTALTILFIEQARSDLGLSEKDSLTKEDYAKAISKANINARALIVATDNPQLGHEFPIYKNAKGEWISLDGGKYTYPLRSYIFGSNFKPVLSFGASNRLCSSEIPADTPSIIDQFIIPLGVQPSNPEYSHLGWKKLQTSSEYRIEELQLGKTYKIEVANNSPLAEFTLTDSKGLATDSNALAQTTDYDQGTDSTSYAFTATSKSLVLRPRVCGNSAIIRITLSR